MDPHPSQKHEKIRLVEINSYLTCYLCKGYLIDATTISECLHSFCRSCIIKFLQENCYCPVCEVIINKAKPCLKLDKTLQDIVYKLVPGLFVSEMHRRKQFYQSRPALAPKVSPEERGEDTERTIFNPQDAISLSIEYISDDSAPGAIPMLTSSSATTLLEEQQHQDTSMKRYLQCPGMCRIEVLKKFVRNKYNVDTNLFYIDILYKRVPLPDHYTLIDIGYIYSWKRNEPMKFFFRITDINTVAERFDYFDGRSTEEVVQRPVKKPNKKLETSQIKRTVVPLKDNNIKKSVPNSKRSEKQQVTVTSDKNAKNNKKVADLEAKVANIVKKVADTIKKEAAEVGDDKKDLKMSEIDEIKTKIQNGKSDVKNQVYTNITLNRDDNVEIITKIQKVSNKDGHPIGLNIINHTVKKTNNNKVQTNNNNNNRLSFSPKLVPVNKANPTLHSKPPPPTFSYRSAVQHEKEERLKNEMREKEKEELEKKSNFLKSIELTAKSALNNNDKPVEPAMITPPPPPLKLSSAQKRKNSSPVKNDKKTKIEKRPVKIIIQPKNIENAAVRQIVSNVNENVNNLSKIVEQTTSNNKTADIQSLIDNCKINIPSSLSITLNDAGEGGARTSPSMPPVKNFIEILKLPEDKIKNKLKQTNNKKSQSENNNSSNNNNLQSFQKIFEESLGGGGKGDALDVSNNSKKALDLTTPDSAPKRKILEIASALQKKTKRKVEEISGKIAIPRVPAQRTLLKPISPANTNQHQTSASLRSSSLGLNYTVSVSQANTSSKTTDNSTRKILSPPSTSSLKATTPAMSPNQILEKYNIQNLAQLTASFNFNPATNGFSPANYSALAQHAMFMKHIERQNWLQQGAPLMQYEKYLQSLGATKSKMMGNIKEN